MKFRNPKLNLLINKKIEETKGFPYDYNTKKKSVQFFYSLPKVSTIALNTSAVFFSSLSVSI